MKYLLIAFALFALARGQEKHVCNCGAFISTGGSELEVHKLKHTKLDDCTQETECAHNCRKEWNHFSDHGDLDHEKHNGTTVGQMMCDELAEHHHRSDFAPHDVYVYYNVCHGPWLFDDLTSQQKLCCEDGTYPGDC